MNSIIGLEKIYFSKIVCSDAILIPMANCEIVAGAPFFWIRIKVGLSPSKKNCVICMIESPLKMMQNAFLFHLKSSFGSQDI